VDFLIIGALMRKFFAVRPVALNATGTRLTLLLKRPLLAENG
jgi:hypothetical protein